MKTFPLPLFVVLLQAYLATAHVDHITVDGDIEITQNGRKIEYKQPNCKEDGPWSCQASKICNDKRVWSLDANEDHAACCLHNQHLSGTADTEFFCCGEEHSVAGSDDAGYSCCPDGQDYDGDVCKEVCKNGKKMVDGECVCPKGTVEGDDGKCKKKKKNDDPPKRCTSGLATGNSFFSFLSSSQRINPVNIIQENATPSSPPTATSSAATDTPYTVPVPKTLIIAGPNFSCAKTRNASPACPSTLLIVSTSEISTATS